MPSVANSILAKFHETDPYAGFDFGAYPYDVAGGGEEGRPVMKQIVQGMTPSLIVEVGTWKGSSALFWASLLRERGIDGAVLCVDTWLGGLEHLTHPPGQQWKINPYRKHGYPTLYYQFLANVCHAGLQDYIVPIPATSVIGARWIAHHNLQVDVVYLDGSHDEDDVYGDLREYWKVLKYDGILCGDDWHARWHGVICAVNRFSRERDLQPRIVPPLWILRKCLSAESKIVLNTIEKAMQALRPHRGDSPPIDT